MQACQVTLPSKRARGPEEALRLDGIRNITNQITKRRKWKYIRIMR